MPPPYSSDPQVAAYLRSLEDARGRQEAQMESLVRGYKRLAQEASDSKLETRRLAAALAKAAKRIRYIEDIPGKRVPYFLNFSIEFPGPDAPSSTIANTQRIANQPISQDGPFVCTTYLSAMLMKTYSLGPTPVNQFGTGRPADPAAGTEVISPLTGRFRPVASTADLFEGSYIGATVGPPTLAGAQTPKTFRPGCADFLFEVFDASVDRNRQNNIPIPSRYIFTENDRPLYLPISDFFERNAAIQFKATPTRDFGFVEVNYAALTGGFAEGNSVPAPDPSAPLEVGRLALSLGGTLYFTMLGYKILQAQSPAV